jgi:hypothetical protein
MRPTNTDTQFCATCAYAESISDGAGRVACCRYPPLREDHRVLVEAVDWCGEWRPGDGPADEDIEGTRQ